MQRTRFCHTSARARAGSATRKPLCLDEIQYLCPPPPYIYKYNPLHARTQTTQNTICTHHSRPLVLIRRNGFKSTDSSIAPCRPNGHTRTTGRATTFSTGRGPHDLESVEREGQSPSTNIEPLGIVRVTPAPASASPGNTLGGAESSHWRGGGVRGTPLTATLPPGWSSTTSPPTAATLLTKRSREPSLPPASPTSCCSLVGGENSTRSPA